MYSKNNSLSYLFQEKDESKIKAYIKEAEARIDLGDTSFIFLCFKINFDLVFY